jgi:hypothetical protein
MARETPEVAEQDRETAARENGVVLPEEMFGGIVQALGKTASDLSSAALVAARAEDVAAAMLKEMVDQEGQEVRDRAALEPLLEMQTVGQVPPALRVRLRLGDRLAVAVVGKIRAQAVTVAMAAQAGTAAAAAAAALPPAGRVAPAAPVSAECGTRERLPLHDRP